MNALNAARASSFGLVALMTFTFGTASGPALADSQTELPSLTIDYTDLDISKPRGAAVLYGRIEQAARIVCGSYPSRELARLQAWNSCYRGAIDNAVATVNQPLLTAMHQGKAGPTPGGSSLTQRTARK